MAFYKPVLLFDLSPARFPGGYRFAIKVNLTAFSGILQSSIC
jgi:hypothetical protein